MENTLGKSHERMLTKEEIIKIIENDPFKMKVLKEVQSLNLPDWLIGAGFVRNTIWDNLHGHETPMTDIDVVYFDPSDLSEETETKYENKLRENIDTDWSVTNQARMARINNQDKNYSSTEDAISHWPETATAIGVTLTEDGKLRLIAPYGIDDLSSLTLRMSSKFGDGYDAFKARIEKKQWLAKWPKLKIVD